VFYAATDFLRLATMLAANASPCAQYYISIPPAIPDGTHPRPDKARQIRALGSNFHAMEEIRFSAWKRWVASTGATWYTAGVTARQYMAAAGFDVSAGDTWALNEVTSAVRRGTGTARNDLRDFLHGLYEGDGTQPAKGVVFVIGVGQRARDISVYQTNLQNWFTDSAFWADMSAYVSDWSQEVYGDVRSYAVPDTPIAVRRDYLNDYLQHGLVLAGAGPPEIEAARSFLSSAYSPLANAAWERSSGYGWTMVPEAEMEGYVSAQVYALRSFSAMSGQAQDHWGFAWAPRNTSGIPSGQFAAQTSQILERLAAAVHDSGETGDPADPGSAACGPPGQNVWCADNLDDGQLTENWKSFRSWAQSALSFTTPPPTILAGTPSAATSLRLVTRTGRAATTATPLTVTLSSSSPQGTFATSPAGPWFPTLSFTMAAGTGTIPAFYYEDTVAGTPALVASAAGATTGTQFVRVTPGPAVSLTITPDSATVQARASEEFAAVGTDAYGNTSPVAATWSLSSPALGTLRPIRGTSTVFTARRLLETGTITASVNAGTLFASATATVAPGRLRIASITYRPRPRAHTVVVTVTTVDAAGKPISHAVVSVVLRRGGRRYLTARSVTGASGHATYGVPVRRAGCFSTIVRRVAAVGFTWSGRSPRNAYCTRRKR
jgi:hypothetical protein